MVIMCFHVRHQQFKCTNSVAVRQTVQLVLSIKRTIQFTLNRNFNYVASHLSREDIFCATYERRSLITYDKTSVLFKARHIFPRINGPSECILMHIRVG